MEAATNTNPRTIAVRRIAGWSSQVTKLQTSRPPLAQYVEMMLSRLAKTKDGEVLIVPVGTRRFLVEREPAYPSRFGKVTLSGAAGLDSYFEGGQVFDCATDAQVLEMAREYAADPDVYMTGHDLTTLSRYVTLALLARRGVRISPRDLPF